MVSIRNNAVWNEKFTLSDGNKKTKLLKCRGADRITGFIRDSSHVKVDIKWLNPFADNPTKNEYNVTKSVLGPNGKLNVDIASPWFIIVVNNISGNQHEITANVQVR